jgi:hypothetical protein
VLQHPPEPNVSNPRHHQENEESDPTDAEQQKESQTDEGNFVERGGLFTEPGFENGAQDKNDA